MRFIDLTGQRFGKLVVLKENGKNEKRKIVKWDCICDCGNFCNVAGIDMKTGNTTSCGCMSSRNFVKELNHTHGMSETPLYKVWRSMKSRCDLPNQKSYKDYGAKGITYCERWKSFENFYEDMKDGYEKGLTIDRIDNNGNYEPNNCRWATRKEQSNNKSDVTIYEINGFKGNFTETCNHFHISKTQARRRIKSGLSLDDVFKPSRQYKK